MSFKMPISKADFEQVYKNDDEKKEQNVKKEEILKNVQKVTELNNKEMLDYAGDAFEYEYLKPDQTTDEQIENLVKDRVSQNKINTQNKLKEQTEEAKATLNEQVQNKKQSFEEERAKIESAYDDAKQNANDDSIRRGIARSSIIMNLLKGYDLSKLATINERGENYKREVQKIEGEIGELDQKLKKSLEELDMASAIEINEQIEKLKKDRDSANQKVIMYNNEVNETLNKNKLDYLNSAAVKDKYAKVEETKSKLKEKITYDLMSYYGSIPLEDALKDFSDFDYSSVLDSNQINIIKNYLNKLR